MNLTEIVNHTEQKPLRIHLPFAPKREVIQSLVEADIGKDWFRCSNPLAVYHTTRQRVDLTLHLLAKRLRC